MFFARPLRLFALPAFTAILTIVGAASADEPETAQAPAGAAVVRAAPVRTDPQSGVQTINVPSGCTPTTQSTGQIVILCPYQEPGSTLPERRTETKWYGWQIVLVDSASLVTGLLVSAATDGESGAGAGLFLTGYALGGPIVHWSNGQVGKGFASLGLRLGAPSLGALSGLALGAALSGGDDISAVVGGVLGMLGGGIAAVVIDSAVLARKTIVVTNEHAARPKVQWTPTAGYDAKRQAATMGITGTF